MPSREELLAAYRLPDRETPRIRMNFIASVDGAATVHGGSAELGGVTDRALMQILRAMADVIVVGAGTVRAEGYGGTGVGGADAAWRTSQGLPAQPPLALVSRGLEIAPQHPFFAEAVARPLVVTCADADAARRRALEEVADVLVCGETSVDLPAMRDALAERGLRQVLCEGGPHLFGALYEDRLVDEVCLTLAPRLVGGDAGRILRGADEAAARLRLLSVLADAEGFVLLRYANVAGGEGDLS
ncbi:MULTISPECIES: pyrimidine reductase family protein [unclassified Microbacterium]|uniref:pyrimidine reductase family protein n=1 Tax=unclassified Microbacterium TaxID=2609290 RepID=UPI00214B2DCA|nr:MULTISPECIES: pyrimidine reductase family protein [unclassified Microbacterium]MCR2810688.1 pyrimidine reductase family protein [Microbacterium sp. zg.B185]WIM18225.1 pyrimidine reductase family protein [Microbacterium sp. zg-B185]